MGNEINFLNFIFVGIKMVKRKVEERSFAGQYPNLEPEKIPNKSKHTVKVDGERGEKRKVEKRSFDGQYMDNYHRREKAQNKKELEYPDEIEEDIDEVVEKKSNKQPKSYFHDDGTYSEPRFTKDDVKDKAKRKKDVEPLKEPKVPLKVVEVPLKVVEPLVVPTTKVPLKVVEPLVVPTTKEVIVNGVPWKDIPTTKEVIVKDVPTTKVVPKMNDKYMVRVLGEKDGVKWHYKKDAIAWIENDKRERVTLELLKINVNKAGQITSSEKLKNYIKKPLTVHQTWMKGMMQNKGIRTANTDKDGKFDFVSASKQINGLYNIAKEQGKIKVATPKKVTTDKPESLIRRQLDFAQKEFDKGVKKYKKTGVKGTIVWNMSEVRKIKL
jgi:hypothetical protein